MWCEWGYSACMSAPSDAATGASAAALRSCPAVVCGSLCICRNRSADRPTPLPARASRCAPHAVAFGQPGHRRRDEISGQDEGTATSGRVPTASGEAGDQLRQHLGRARLCCAAPPCAHRVVVRVPMVTLCMHPHVIGMSRRRFSSAIACDGQRPWSRTMMVTRRCLGGLPGWIPLRMSTIPDG